MPYTHFGKQADVWKHLSLCEVMVSEQPQIYIETNSAGSGYSLDNTPEQRYGIYSFLEKAPDYKELLNSKYFELESMAIKDNKYLGSPGLAMSILGNTVDKFIFFDIEESPLDNIARFARQNQIADKTETINRDSVTGVMDLLSILPNSTLIHIDPYCIDEPGPNGYNYIDLFVKASELGLKCFLWYGFNTLDEKKQINDFITENLKNSTADNLSCVELIMEVIQKDTIPCNPGILGSGLLSGNLSEKSLFAIVLYSELLIGLYKGTSYNNFKGNLYRDIIELKSSDNHLVDNAKNQLK